jgi:hypothetical protein
VPIHALPFDPAAVSLIAEMAEAILNEAKAQPLPRHLLAKRITGFSPSLAVDPVLVVPLANLTVQGSHNLDPNRVANGFDLLAILVHAGEPRGQHVQREDELALKGRDYRLCLG